MQNKKEKNPIDFHVGQKIKLKRKMLGMTQCDLGNHIGITFQQIQKYETGENRVSASTLYDIAAVLETNIDYFFYGLDVAEDVSLDKHALTFIKSFNEIKCEVVKKRLIHLINSINEN